jgi:hypothetical protein
VNETEGKIFMARSIVKAITVVIGKGSLKIAAPRTLAISAVFVVKT